MASNGTPISARRSAPSDDLAEHPFVARLGRIGQHLRHGDAAHRWLLDLGVVVMVYLLFGIADLIHRAPPEALVTFTPVPVATVVFLQVGLILPLFWRRRFPTITFYVIVAIFALQWSLGVVLRADAALLVAVYSVVLHGTLSRLPWTALTAVAATTLVAIRVSTAVSVWDALFFLLSAVTAAAALGFAVKLRRAQLATLRERAAQLEIERDQRSRLAAVTERTRVAREMHDILGHNLSVIITLADGGAYAAPLTPERGIEALRLIGDTGRRALADLRRVLGVLREHNDAPEWNPQPDIAAIGPLCDQIQAAGPRVSYRTSGDVETLDRGLQLTAYRVVQEAFTNSLRHAGPHTRIHLTLTVADDRLCIVVHDTGPVGGLGTPARESRAGQGLIGMRERVAIYNGTTTAGPNLRGGWTVHATLDVAGLRTIESNA